VVTMRAVVVDRYGPPDVARIAEVPRPVPRKDEVLVRVVAAAVTSGDARIRGGRFPPGFALPARLAFGLRGPRRRILGMVFSGIIEEVGPGVANVAPGHAVCGMTGMSMGAHAEYVCVAARKVAAVPSGVSHSDAAGLLFGGSTALYFLRDKASVGPGMTVLVNGASGAVGSNAVQLATHFGATVTGVTSAGNADLVRRLRADRVIDYAVTDVRALSDRFDVVFDAVGNLSIASGRQLLRDGGVLVLAVASLWDMLRARRGVVAGSGPERAADFEWLLQLVAANKLTVVVDRTFPLDHIGDAYRLVDSGHKRGNVIVRP
jgi:NADPH:quinone reductase-like Zn-dependent oxidoreductase